MNEQKIIGEIVLEGMKGNRIDFSVGEGHFVYKPIMY